MESHPFPTMLFTHPYLLCRIAFPLLLMSPAARCETNPETVDRADQKVVSVQKNPERTLDPQFGEAHVGERESSAASRERRCAISVFSYQASIEQNKESLLTRIREVFPGVGRGVR